MLTAMRTVCAALLLAGCAHADAGPIDIAPYPVEYSCVQQKLAAKELRSLGPNSELGRMIADYGAEREALRKLHHMPAAGRCR